MARFSKTGRGPARIVGRMSTTTMFEITAWDETTYDDPDEGPPLKRVGVRKRFSGPLEGTSVAEVLIAGDAGYVASERVEGRLEGRRGTFVIQHGGVGDHAFGHIVPGSGTGELAGLAGGAVFAHDDAGARLTLSYALAERS
jgi:Protein of unknown function (DUF3224)